MTRNLVPGGLPIHWNLCNVQENPYFQTTLGESSARYPLSLFVSRGVELEHLLAGIGGGESATSWRIQQAALEAPKRKSMVVSVGDVAGSGGYLICYPCG